jgi:hypothetical protein
MKVFLLRGGLGNQLFIYGAYSDSKNKHLGFSYLDDKYGFQSDSVYKRKNKLLELGLQYKKTRIDFRFIWRLIALFKDDTTFFCFSNKYYQQSIYLDNIKMNFSDNISRLCIHIRIKDYSLKLKENEYKELIEYVKNKYPLLPIVFLTDDESLFRKEMSDLFSQGECLNLNEIEAFYFMAESSHIIISDSSFSFASAYLGKNKVIIYRRLTNIIINGDKQHQWIKL